MSINELTLAYEARKPMLIAYGEWVAYMILDELEKKLGSKESVNKFLQIPVTPRVKETTSFIEKATVRKPTDKPFEKITDQVAERFVVLKLKDIDLVCQVIESIGWKSRKDRDFLAEREQNPDYFAYQSDHYIVWNLKEITYQGVVIPAGTPCEIQIRTILQHAYAEMAHEHDYKPKVDLRDNDKRKIKRALAKGSALIETTDEVFHEICSKVEAYNSELAEIMSEASRLYFLKVGIKANDSSKISKTIAEAYRDKLKSLTPTLLSEWVESQSWLSNSIVSKRNDSVFFRDAILIITAWLVSKYRLTVKNDWPYDLKILSDLFVTMGVSTSDLF